MTVQTTMNDFVENYSFPRRKRGNVRVCSYCILAQNDVSSCTILDKAPATYKKVCIVGNEVAALFSA